MANGKMKMGLQLLALYQKKAFGIALIWCSLDMIVEKITMKVH